MDINRSFIITIYYLILTTINYQFTKATTTSSTNNQGQSQNSGSANVDNSNTVTSVYKPNDPGSCNYDFTGPADDIFIIDRSESVNQDNFHRAKVFIKDLIQSSFILRHTDNRIAVITYTSEPTQKFNFLHVTSASEVLSECELFLPGGLWDHVLFDNVMKNGANLQGALIQAKDVFRRVAPDRISVTKRLWIFTDFENTQVSVSPGTDFPGVKFYGAGIGSYNRDEEDKNFYDIITEEPGCRYRKLQDWEDAMKTFARVGVKQGFNLGPDVPVSDVNLCQSVKNCSSQCTCQEFDHQTTSLKCSFTNDQGSLDTAISDDSWTIIRVVFATVFSIIFIVIVVLFIWCCCKLRAKKQPEKFQTLPTLTRSEGTTTDTLSTNATDASTYTNTTLLQSGQYPTLQPQVNGLPNPGEDEDLYVNGEIADILKAHGIVQDGTNPRNNVAQNRTRSEIKGPGKYKKNNKLCETVSAPANIEPSRQISVISTATSNHSYIEPIRTPDPHDQFKHPYSYAYMDSLGNRHEVPAPSGNNLKSPASSHSYEKFNFNPDQSQHKPGSNDFNAELTSKLQRMRNRISGAFSKKGKKHSNVNNESNNTSSNVNAPNNIKFPQYIPNPSLYQKNKETQPVYMDPNTSSNSLPPQLQDANGVPGDRSSAKLGTMKFKNLLYKFSGSDQEIVANPAVNQYEPGPNGPYSLVHENNRSMDKPPSFKEIL